MVDEDPDNVLLMAPRALADTRRTAGELARPRSAPDDVERNPYKLYMTHISAGSRPTMASSLKMIRREFFPASPRNEDVPWHHIGYVQLLAIRDWLTERYKPATANRILSALRGLLRQAYRAGLIDSEHYTRAKEVERITGNTIPAGRSLSAGELRAVFDACDLSTTLGARNAAMLALLYGCGLRRAEVRALDVAHYDPDTRAVKVRGKRRKERIVYAPVGTMRAVERWLTYRGDTPGPLICPLEGYERKAVRVDRRFSLSAIDQTITRIAKVAGVRHFVPHDLRRTFVGDMLDADVDLSTVQRLAGHASPTTTARYDRRPERAKAAAAERLHVPFLDDSDSDLP